jgi:hypothetical protein
VAATMLTRYSNGELGCCALRARCTSGGASLPAEQVLQMIRPLPRLTTMRARYIVMIASPN